jgi:predicted flavoprotein YhiN
VWSVRRESLRLKRWWWRRVDCRFRSWGRRGSGMSWLASLGLKVVAPRPALVPLVLGGDEKEWTEMAGVAAEVVASAGGAKFREKMLVTHRGVSGPAVLAGFFVLAGRG